MAAEMGNIVQGHKETNTPCLNKVFSLKNFKIKNPLANRKIYLHANLSGLQTKSIDSYIVRTKGKFIHFLEEVTM